MPAFKSKRAFKKTFKRKRVFRKKRMSPPYATRKFANLGTGIPDKLLVNLRYVQPFTMTIPGASINTTQQFRLNGMYYPASTASVDHFAMNWQQYSPLYDLYAVAGCKFKLTFSTSSNSTYSDNVAAGFYFSDAINTVVPANLQALAEQPGAKWKMISSDQTYNTILKGRFSSKKMFGKGLMSNPNLVCFTGSNTGITNPASAGTSILVAWLSSTIGGITAGTTWYLIAEIDYSVLFWQRHQFAMQT